MTGWVRRVQTKTILQNYKSEEWVYISVWISDVDKAVDL